MTENRFDRVVVARLTQRPSPAGLIVRVADDQYCQAHRELTGEEAVPVGVHAGIECGVIRKAIPEMDAIAISPDFYDGHSPKERLDLDSCEVFCRIVERVIELL